MLHRIKKKHKITWYNIIILTNYCNMRPCRLKALSIVHSTYSKIRLKMALQFGRNM